MTCADVIAHLDSLYARRARDGATARESAALIEAPLAPDAHLRDARPAYELLWRLSRARFFLGQLVTEAADDGRRGLTGDEAEAARREHARGVRAGLRASRLAPEQVEGHFWAGVNLALRARCEPRLVALPLALRARKHLRRAARIDSAYHGAGAPRVLARLASRLPRSLGGGARRARQLYEQALALAPANTVTRLYFAELLVEQNDTRAARAHLAAIINSPPDPAWLYETERDRRRAIELLRELDG